MQKKSPDFIGKALMISLVYIVVDLTGGFAHLQLETWFRYAMRAVLIVGIIIVCVQYGKQMSNQVTFGNVFGFGMKTTTIIAILITIYAFISYSFIFPELRNEIIEQSRVKLEADGRYSEDMIDQQLAMIRKFLLPGLMIGTLIGIFLVGLIASLLGAAFTKKSEPDIFNEQSS